MITENDLREWVSDNEEESVVEAADMNSRVRAPILDLRARMTTREGWWTTITSADILGKIANQSIGFVKLAANAIASQADVSAGTRNDRLMTPLRTKEQFNYKLASRAARITGPGSATLTLHTVPNEMYIDVTSTNTIGRVYSFTQSWVRRPNSTYRVEDGSGANAVLSISITGRVLTFTVTRPNNRFVTYVEDIQVLYR